MTVLPRSRGPDCWHRNDVALARFVSDLIAGELKQLRRGGGELPPTPWPAGLAIGEDGLGLDSLERMEVASALSEALHLHASGVEDLLLARRTIGEWIGVAARGLAHFDSQLAFRTSGSSGASKSCVHALNDLAQEVDHLATLFPGTRRILTAVPSHHIYGFLFTVLLPERLGKLEVLDARLMTPRALTGQLQAGDLLISHPTHWSLMARHGGAFPPGVTGVSSTAPCAPELAQALTRSEGGLGRLVQIYGSTETAGVGWRESPMAPFKLMPHWSRAPAGELDLLGPTNDGSVRTATLQDAVEWLDERQFQVAGRLDAAVQVGGVNVYPRRVGAILSAHPQVGEAAVRLMTAGEGHRLKAFVVPTIGADTDVLRAELEHWANQHLSGPERPKAYTFGARLPVNENGKGCDWS